jgi:hypothetical protein
MSHTGNDDLLHSRDMCLFRTLGLFWVAWLFIQGLEGVIDWVWHGARRETKQQDNDEIKYRQNRFGKSSVRAE